MFPGAAALGLPAKSVTTQHGESPTHWVLTLALNIERDLSLQGANGFILDKLGSDLLNIKTQLKWCS